MGRVGIGVLILSLGALPACRSYHPMPLSPAAVEARLQPPDADSMRVRGQELKHPILPPLAIDLRDGLSPDEAAVLAVIANPALRAERNRRAIADAQVLQAGILPNPQLALGFDFPTVGATGGTVPAFGVGLSWDHTSLIGRRQRVDAAEAQRAQVELDVAWLEWQTAEAAKIALVRLAGLERQADLAAEGTTVFLQNAARLKSAVDAGFASAVEQAAADAAAVQAQATLLDLRKQAGQQRIALARLLGLPPDTDVHPQVDALPACCLDVPPLARLLDGLEQRRLDLVALRHGFASQEATLHATVLGQFPRINLGVTQARDTSNVGTTGIGVTIDLPIFDRNQGHIALEEATRQQLFDEYASRLFDARADVALLVDALGALGEQVRQARDALPALSALADAYRAALDLGQADAMSAFAAWNEALQKRVEVAALEQEAAEARIALELASGRFHLEEAVTDGTVGEEAR